MDEETEAQIDKHHESFSKWNSNPVPPAPESKHLITTVKQQGSLDLNVMLKASVVFWQHYLIT